MSKFLIHREQNLVEYSNQYDISAVWSLVNLAISSAGILPKLTPQDPYRDPIYIITSGNPATYRLQATVGIDSTDLSYYTFLSIVGRDVSTGHHQWFLGSIRFTSADPFYDDESGEGYWNFDTGSFELIHGGVDSRDGDIVYTRVKAINSDYLFLAIALKNSDGLEEITVGYDPLYVETPILTYHGTGLYVYQSVIKKGVVLDAPLISLTSGTPELLDDNWVSLNPEYNYTERDAKQEDIYRTRSGQRYVYKWGDWKNWKFDVKYVNCEIRTLVNTWWNDNADLLYVEDNYTRVDSVRLENARLPIGKLIKPYEDLFQGVIELGTY